MGGCVLDGAECAEGGADRPADREPEGLGHVGRMEGEGEVVGAKHWRDAVERGGSELS